eukprot:TRINITY_DN35330_c0_g1_i1.p1 TRINITY_DN35330_c0_g1~~TRINITY_DN35330_c0_g1_i1.p1  ORF type:complete len:420 (-),score=39.42 TRINITY_DN35330_c0_g1_i1:71-1330(-)
MRSHVARCGASAVAASVCIFTAMSESEFPVERQEPLQHLGLHEDCFNFVPFPREQCCSSHMAHGGEGGNWKCWNRVYTYERCCTFWPPRNVKEDWAVLPLHKEPFVRFGLHNGVALNIVQADIVLQRDHDAVGAVLWRGGAALARWADTIPNLWRGRRVLEIAAGVGLPSAVAAVYGANVTATDISGVSRRCSSRNLHDATRHRLQPVSSRQLPTAQVRGRQATSFTAAARTHHGVAVARLDIHDARAVRRFRRQRGVFDLVMGSSFLSLRYHTVATRTAVWTNVASLLPACWGAMVTVALESPVLDELAGIPTGSDSHDGRGSFGSGESSTTGLGTTTKDQSKSSVATSDTAVAKWPVKSSAAHNISGLVWAQPAVAPPLVIVDREAAFTDHNGNTVEIAVLQPRLTDSSVRCHSLAD